MRIWPVWIVLVVCVLCTGAALAQESAPDLVVGDDIAITSRIDVFGQQIQVAQGQLMNNGSSAFTNISLLADVYDDQGTIVGEGFGFIVDACGTGLVDFALQPGGSHDFSITLELYEDDVTVDHVIITPEGSATEPAEIPDALPPEITSVSRQEVVALEWIDTGVLRYGVGCDGGPFTALTWYEYDLRAKQSLAIAHPKAELVTDALLTQLDLADPALYNRAHLSFAPDARRLVYQTDLNTLVTAEPDGSFKRVLYDDLYNRSLHGIQWLNEGRFLAYYFGAYGEPVAYFTASVDGERISSPLSRTTPSLIVPGATPDGLRAVIGATFDDVTGYYYKSTLYETNELLFEAELPGNNWPAPVFTRQVDGSAYVFIARPTADVARLQCFDMQTRELHDLLPLPLDLTSDSRAWMWLSPDRETLALAANGVSGGLWLIDLGAFDACR